MNSPYGMRGAICERFGWTLDYLENKIPWIDAYYMMIDAPRFEPDKTKPGENEANKTPEKEEKPKTAGEKLNSFLNKFS